MALEVADREYVKAHASEKTIREWESYFNNKYTKNQISNVIYHNNLRPKKIQGEELSQLQSQRSRKYHINQDFFKTWSRDMAYILGLWFADGCIYRNQMFDITLHTKDKYILKKIAEKIEYEGPLYDYVDKQAARLNFSCVVIYKDIVALGGTENKSLTIEFPYVPDEYLNDFIRGYFDGDGCVMNLKDNRLNTAFTSGSKKFLDSLWQILRDKAGVRGGSYDASCVSLKFGKQDSIRIAQYMYKDNPELFLKRKREKFTNYIS